MTVTGLRRRLTLVLCLLAAPVVPPVYAADLSETVLRWEQGVADGGAAREALSDVARERERLGREWQEPEPGIVWAAQVDLLGGDAVGQAELAVNLKQPFIEPARPLPIGHGGDQIITPMAQQRVRLDPVEPGRRLSLEAEPERIRDARDLEDVVRTEAGVAGSYGRLRDADLGGDARHEL